MSIDWRTFLRQLLSALRRDGFPTWDWPPKPEEPPEEPETN
jgi:hypothetical protein